jgi:hypothetical protein
VGLSARVETIRRDIDLTFQKDLSAKARSAYLAQYAAEGIKEAQQQNARILGRPPPYDVWVDGREGAPLTSVKPDGIIVAEFELVSGALLWIYQQLETHSPRLTGQYASSHVLFADETEVTDISNPPPADEYTFVNTQPYARKIEGIRARGGMTTTVPISPQAPDGVYQAVATLVRSSKFGNAVKATFSYRTIRNADGTSRRNPAIIVRMR